MLTLNAKINLNLFTEKLLIPHKGQTLYVLQRLIAMYCENRGTRWCSWLRHCATSAGSIPDDVFAIFHRHNPSGRIMALGLTRPLTEMSTRNIS
jgi:hypothetical protein